ncbi:Uncharacterized protein TPAR_01489 [Tolypocladium paradoxum]|uniref:Uncharacterized protein n=1 Tax=Tolypocladium paradoxum TaxID=94208 RepID=A0A2S4L7C2_9HYPO|nr:Uncharacterized protein TPAR_01489 [Tolypocladium paradoxum]
MSSKAWNEMATPAELLAVFTTATAVLVTAILIRRLHGRPLKPPKSESRIQRIDDIQDDDTDNLDRNARSIVGQDPVLQGRAATSAPKAKKSLTLRIDGIPADHTDNLDSNLTSIIEQDPVLRGDADTAVRRSLAPFGKGSLCATISIITSLSADDLSTRLRRAGNGRPYRYSCKFEGITPLYESEGGANVDIIAVPGLGSHALGSWKSPISDDVWLRDFLPGDVPNIRVLLYGYDTTLPGSLSKQSIEDLGGSLLEQIIAFRASDRTSHRPIIFIGHSLGGLLIKEALVRARRGVSGANSDLSKATFGLLFFGVPNLGLRNDQLRTLVQGQPNQALIDDLLVDNDSEASNFLTRLATQFSESCKGYYRVVTFFERVRSKTLREQDGKWGKTGPPSLLVTDKSATSTGLVAVADEDNIALNKDHSDLVKYDSQSQGEYTVVRERIKRLVDEAKLEVAKRFAEHILCEPQPEATQACLRSLAFQDMDGRRSEIGNAAEGTCKWLVRHETLIQWTRQDRRLLWIKGKPGSGKSTIMKYALHELPAIYAADTLAFSFFVHGRGHELQRSLLGLFRSILHQFLRRVPGALPDLVNHFDERRKTEGEPGEKWQWHMQPLQAFFESSLPRILQRFPVILIIDALDEAGEQSAVELIDYLKHVLKSLPPTNSRFGVCFSCRHYPILELEGGSTILLDAENNADIRSYVQGRFSASYSDADLESFISHRSQGVFVWAHFVVERVLRLKRQGESRGKIEAEIKRIPQDLDDLYRELIQGVENRADTLRLMKWICFSTRPLKTVELQWAMAVDTDCSYKTLDECQSSDNFIANDNIGRRITALSCGLAETVPSDDDRIVQFIHQSVKDFFVEGGLMALDNPTTSANLVVPAAHCRLSRACLYYFKMAAHCHGQPFDQADTSRFPFIRYATTSWVSHAKLGEPAETSPTSLLDLLGWPIESESLIKSWAFSYHEAGDRLYPDGTKLIHVISRHGLAKLLPCLLEECGEIGARVNVQDGLGRTPLSWAARYGQEAVVNLLLDTGKVDVNARDKDGRSPLWYAAKKGYEAVVRQLLAIGEVDINARDEDGRSPLLYAAWNGHEAVVRLLLNTGKVDINARDEDGLPPLLYAAQRGHEGVAQLLLGTGKTDVDVRDENGRMPPLWELELLVRGRFPTGKARDCLDSEGQAVADLLQFLRTNPPALATRTRYLSDEPLHALNTLVFSENIGLQWGASLTFAEFTEQDVREVDCDALEPILFLLQSSDISCNGLRVPRCSTLPGKVAENKVLIVQMGGLQLLIRHMLSTDIRVQRNAVGCILELAVHEENMAKIACSGALGPLIWLAKSRDMKVQSYAMHALLNMTLSNEARRQLVNADVIPVLVQLLSSPYDDIQNDCIGALGNIAIDASNRRKLALSETKLVSLLVNLIGSHDAAVLTLRNLALDENYQLDIVRSNGLAELLHLLQFSDPSLIFSATACIHNISMHPLTKSPIIEAGFLQPLVDLLGSTDYEKIQYYTISTLRNLAASSDRNKALVLDAGLVQTCKQIVLDIPVTVQSEMATTIAILALSNELNPRLLNLGVLKVLIPLTHSPSITVQGNSAAALRSLSSKVLYLDATPSFATPC